jgi:crotonobetainyl-CoA:carnitine CoA-transferase CaiB-like acyl-CoA transferase
MSGLMPLSGVKVVDFTQLIAGPSATMLLADMGADVIKVEQIEGELSRRLGASLKSTFLAYNRHKRSISMNLKHPEAKEIVRKLVAQSDIVVQGFSPGAMERMGLGYQDLLKVQPRLVYASLTGFGRGESGDTRKGVDAVVQAETGMMAVTGQPDGPPVKVGFQVVDAAAGLALAQGILASLRLRDMTGEPQFISTSLYEVNVFLQGPAFVHASATGTDVPRMGNTSGALGYPTDLFEASDGGYIQLAAYLPEQWRLLCEAIERPELFRDPRFVDGPARVENMTLLRAELQRAIGERPRDEWTSRFRADGIIAGPVLAHSEVMNSVHARENDCFVPSESDGVQYAGVRMPAKSDWYQTDGKVTAPALGADTEKILAELGYQEKEITALRDAGTLSAI